MIKSAVYVGTRNLYEDMIPAVKSLLINSDVDVIYLLIEDDAFPQYLPECVKTINVSGQTYFPKDSPNVNYRWTYMTLMRAALTKVLPDVDVILSMDDDVIAMRDMSGVWDLPIDDYYYAAAEEPYKSKGGKGYVCDYYGQMGVVLFNLKKLREDGKDDEVIRYLNTKKCPFVEQTAFNLNCQGGIYPMSAEYNMSNYTKKEGIPKIVHYAAIWNWNTFSIVNHYRGIPWEEVERIHNENINRRSDI